jgi:two-component system response regulator PilR (NtrC family)/two-component system response regulator HydG
MTERILVVEDDPEMLETCSEVIKRGGYEVVAAESGRVAEQILRTSAVDVVITDLKMPKGGGLDVLRVAKEADPEIVVILITAFPTVETAVEAMKFGASDYLMKPFSGEQLLAVVERSLEQRRRKETYGFLRSQLQKSFKLSGIVGRGREMLRLFDDIRKAASVDADLLILGESGAGKEIVARAIHNNSGRREKPFLPINCAAIPEHLLEAELFGYERGAFTGAVVSKEGLLESADGGTLFLDEVCEMGPSLQAKLLRVLEEGSVRRVGGRKTIPYNVRFMTSTNRDIYAEVKKGRFREDIFFRINVIEIKVPPLRERHEDIPLLTAHFLEVYSNQYAKKIDGITREAMELLTMYDWPGNVRELRNAIERAVTYAKESFITQEDLPETVLRGAEGQDRYNFHEWKEKTLERLEKEFLEKALEEHDGNVTHSAKALGIHRSTLQRLMRKYNLTAV